MSKKVIVRKKNQRISKADQAVAEKLIGDVIEKVGELQYASRRLSAINILKDDMCEKHAEQSGLNDAWWSCVDDVIGAAYALVDTHQSQE